MDDECVLCNRLVRWIAHADHQDKFRITGLKGKTGMSLLKQYGKENTNSDSLVLIEQDKLFEASEAAWRIVIALDRFYWLGVLIRNLPLRLRDSLYYFVARRRYSLFGKSQTCSLDNSIVKKIIRENADF